MIITYYGNQFFKIAQGDTVIAINPPEKSSTKFGSNLALSTTNHPDYNGFDRVTHGETIPFHITGAGEYECAGIAVQGKGTTTTIDGKEYNTAVYSFVFEDTKLGFIGPISKPLLASEMEILNNCDILFVPITTLGAANANKVAVAIEPKIIIPMDYTKENLKTFLKEAGEEKVEPLDKLTIRRKEIEAKEGEVIVLAEN
jgi:L-ascorbate metabolism protein UlaG (beta-lactamase superfamily)